MRCPLACEVQVRSRSVIDRARNKYHHSTITAVVIANMIGTGVFTTTGFMAVDLSPGAILAAWVLGGVLALCGAVVYLHLGTVTPAPSDLACFFGSLKPLCEPDLNDGLPCHA